MFKTFVLLATIWNPQTNVADVYELDGGLNGAGCTTRLVQVYESEAVELEPGFVVRTADVVLSCEIDEHEF